MEDATVGAITATWHADPTTAQRWFWLINHQYKVLEDADEYQDLDEPEVWQQFQQQLAGAAGEYGIAEHAVQAFASYVDDSGAAVSDVITELAAGWEQAGEIYEQRFNEVWVPFLAQWNGGWNGTEESWPEFRQGFVYYGYEAGLAVPTNHLAELLDAQSVTERVTTLASYGIAIHQPEPADAGTDGATADPEAWGRFLSSRSRKWDGKDETWPEFRRTFLAAAPKALATSAEDFVAYAESQDDKVEVLESYGITVGLVAAATTDTDTAETAEDEADETDTVLTEADLIAFIDELTEDVITPSIEELLADMPEAAELPRARLRELLAEAMHEELASAAAEADEPAAATA